LFVISTRDDATLRIQAGRFAEAMERAKFNLDDVCFTLAVGRAHFDHRLAIVCDSMEQLTNDLRAFATDNHLDQSPRVIHRSVASGDEASNRIAQLAQTYVGGESVPWDAAGWQQLFGRGGKKISLPTYPFQRQRRWFENRTDAIVAADPARESAVSRAARSPAGSPLLGNRLDLAGEHAVFETDLNAFDFLRDHRVGGAEVMPASGLLELAFAAGHAETGRLLSVTNLKIRKKIVRRPGKPCRVQVILQSAAPVHHGRIAVREDSGWSTVATFVLAREIPTTKVGTTIPSRDHDARPIPISEHYEVGRRLNLDYGPAFRGALALFQSDSSDTLAAWGTASLPPEVDARGYVFHPALLDACFQIAAGTFRHLDQTWLPIGIDAMTINRIPDHTKPLQVYATAHHRSDKRQTSVQMMLQNEAGDLVASIENLMLQALTPERQFTASNDTANNDTANNDTARNDSGRGGTGAGSDREPGSSSRLTSYASAAPRPPAAGKAHPGALQSMIHDPDAMREFLHTRVADVLGLTVAEVPVDQPLDGLGLDSLMAFELRDELEREFGIVIPIDAFLDEITFDAFLATVMTLLRSAKGEATGADTTAAVQPETKTANGWTEGEI
jgi:acyl transferase domain-containing protein/acyl carrier protein